MFVFPPHRTLCALWKSEDVEGKWKGTPQFKKRNNRALRAAMTDYDRFQVMIAKKDRSAKRAKA